MSTDEQRTALFSQGRHRAMRWAADGFVALCVFGFVMATAQAIGRAIGKGDASGLLGLWVAAPMSIVLFGLRHFMVRQQEVWGSAEGLDVGVGDRMRRIPWPQVGPPEWTWSSFNMPGSMGVAFFEIAGANESVYFFAGDTEIALLCQMRGIGIAEAQRRASDTSISPTASSRPGEVRPSTHAAPPERQPFSLVFIPVVVVVIVVTNGVLILLQNGRAGLAATVLAGAIFLALLLAGLRKVS